MIYKRLIYISALIFTAACSTGKYICEVPYHYSTDSFRKAAQAHKDSITQKATTKMSSFQMRKYGLKKSIPSS